MQLKKLVLAVPFPPTVVIAFWPEFVIEVMMKKSANFLTSSTHSLDVLCHMCASLVAALTENWYSLIWN